MTDSKKIKRQGWELELEFDSEDDPKVTGWIIKLSNEHSASLGAMETFGEVTDSYGEKATPVPARIQEWALKVEDEYYEEMCKKAGVEV